MDPRIRGLAEQCARRLDGHRSDAATFHAVRSALTATGGLAASVGGVLTLALPDDTDTAMTITAIGGGVIALIGTFVGSLIGDPSDRLNRHARGFASWRRAIEAINRQDNSEIQYHLLQCLGDQGGEVTSPGSAAGNPQVQVH